MSKRSKRRARAMRKASRALQHSPPPESQVAAREQPDFGDEYRYVLADLRRIGILSAVMIALLVVLSLLPS